MSEDIGPGDVVEAIDPTGLGRAPHGQRFTVLQVCEPTDSCACNRHPEPHGGLKLCEIDGRWCIYEFRKIGGSRSDTILRFAEDLSVKAPSEKVDA